jgi:hypothetical protein
MVLALLFSLADATLCAVSIHVRLDRRHIFYLKLTQISQAIKFMTIAGATGVMPALIGRVSFAIWMLPLVRPWKLSRWALYFYTVFSIILVSIESILSILAQYV